MNELMEVLEDQGIDKTDLAICGVASIMTTIAQIYIWRRYGRKTAKVVYLYSAFTGMVTAGLSSRRVNKARIRAINNTMSDIAAQLDLPVSHVDGMTFIGDPRTIEGYKLPDGIAWPQFEGVDFSTIDDPRHNHPSHEGWTP